MHGQRHFLEHEAHVAAGAQRDDGIALGNAFCQGLGRVLHDVQQGLDQLGAVTIDASSEYARVQALTGGQAGIVIAPRRDTGFKLPGL